MRELDLGFEPADYAGAIWLLTGMLAFAEAVRYVRHGRRPASVTSRGMIVGVAACLIIVLVLDGRLSIRRFSHGEACLILGLLLVPWLFRSYAVTTRPLSRPLRWFLLALRGSAAAVALLMLARPVLLWTTIQRERAILGILVDTSQSMGVRDVVPPTPPGEPAPEPLSRIDASRQMVNASRKALNLLTDKIDVQWMAFDARVRRTDSHAVRAEGGITSLGRGLDGAREALIQTGARIAGLIVISDGRDTASGTNDPLQAGDELAVAGIPLFSIGVGNELPAGQTRSLTARRLDMSDRITVLNRLDIGAEFLAAGLVGSTIDVRLEYDDAVVATQKLHPSQVRELVRAEFSHVAKQGGLHQVTVVATVPELGKPQGEARLSRYVRVTDDKLQVLYVDRARYERAAVARALEYAKDINLTKIDLNRPPGTPVDDLLPASREAWRVFHVVIVGDVARANMPDTAMQALAEQVRQEGRGAALLGGARTIGSGNYAGSPFDKLFSIDLSSVGQLAGPIGLQATPAGRVHPILQLGTDPAKDVWKRLPPLTGAGLLGKLSPTAEVLLESTSSDPLMVVQQSGTGRTAVLAFDSTWQWPFANDDGLETHRRFWRQLVLWLANRKPEVWTLAERSQYDLGRLKSGDEQVVVRAGINDPGTGGLPAGSSLTGELIAPDGRISNLAWSPGGEGFEAKPAVDLPGQYRVRVEGKVGGQSAGQAETAFMVETVDRELSEPFADLDVLQRLAARTATIGGAYVPMDQFGSLLERIRASGTETRITRVQRDYIVDDHPWPWLLAFIGLLAVEWIVRRLAGLV